MGQAYQRGLILYGHKRFELAAREFREALSEGRSHALAQSQLASCLHARGYARDAVREARDAIRVAPDTAYCFYRYGWILTELQRYGEAEAAALEAIRLEPMNADYQHLLARLQAKQCRWAAILLAADRGLTVHPTHAGCLYFRSVALVKLGEKQAAAETLTAALAHHPEDDAIHASQGWALLHQGQHQQGLDHSVLAGISAHCWRNRWPDRVV